MLMKVGIIGCGKIAQVRHIPEYLDNKNVEIVGLYDFVYDRAKELADKFGGTAFASVEELLADESIAAVSVCVANNAHAETTIKALRAGKHVLCEKPMAITLEECEEMVKTAEECGKYLMIGQNQRLTKAHIRAKELVAAGAIGKVVSFRTVFGHGGPETWSIDPGKNSWFFDKNKAAMGAMADLGVHKTDLIQYILGENVVETTAKVMTLDKKDSEGNLIGVDDNAICIYQMESGAVGTMMASWSHYAMEDNSTVIYGDAGTMYIYNSRFYALEVLKRDGEKIYYDLEPMQDNDHQTKSGIIDQFVEAVVNDHEPIISGKSVLPAMRAVFASIESSKSGRSVAIDKNKR